MQTNAISTAPASVQDTIDRLNAPSTILRQSAAASLDSADFLRLMTAQLANQDPLEPQSNEQMLAQLAQFSSLEATVSSEARLSEISAKLDALIEAQRAAAEAAERAASTTADPPTRSPEPGTAGNDAEFSALT